MNKKKRSARSTKADPRSPVKRTVSRKKSGRSPTNGKGNLGKGSVAVVNHRAGCAPQALLEETLDMAEFWECLERRRTSVKKKRHAFRIVIKPDLEMYDSFAPTGTDPRLVEFLITLLHRRGFRQVSIVDGIDSSDLWLENREVSILADFAGYRYQTDDGRGYAVINLCDNVVDAGFDADSVLAGSTLGEDWIDADFRISFAKKKTHQEFGYSLCIQNIIGVLPLRDKEYHYFHRLDPGEVCLALLDRTPVHFALIDAVVSNHGSDGVYNLNPLSTDTIVASENVVLCDFAAALKMGLDPYVSRVNAIVLRKKGLPERYEIHGDLTTYKGWQNVPFALSDSVRKRNASVIAHRMAKTWLQSVNREIFPFKNDIDERINNTVTRWLRELDTHPLGLMGVIAMNYLIAWWSQAIQGYRVLYDKERVSRRLTSLGIDLSQYSGEDFEKIVAYMEPFAHLVAHTSPDRNGLRWRYIDHSVVFEYKRILPIPFKKFVSRVDIGEAVRMLNDNIGGALRVVARNDAGQVTHQAERNLYLPQPNWIVLFGGDIIDVGKLEYIRYQKDRHQIFWKAVNSANQSAKTDDGIITFASARKNTTEITIVARQEFTLPLFWQVFNVDYLPKIKDALVSDSYITYFSRSIANYEAAFEGREARIGREWDIVAGEEGCEKPWLPIEQLADAAIKFFEIVRPLIVTMRQGGLAGSIKTDENKDIGPSVNPSNISRLITTAEEGAHSFFRDFLEAVEKDAAMMGRVPWDGLL